MRERSPAVGVTRGFLVMFAALAVVAMFGAGYAIRGASRGPASPAGVAGSGPGRADRAVSYDTLYFPVDAPEAKFETDLRYVKDQGATSVYVTANESDTHNGQKLTRALQIGHALGLRVYIDPYVGGTFSGDEGDSASAYLGQHPGTGIISRRGVPANLPSVNDSDYRSYVKQLIGTFLTYDFDGILLDEPSMPAPLDQMAPGDYFPYDPPSRSLFQAAFGHDMPIADDAETVAFRQTSMQSYIADLLDFIKMTRPTVTTMLVVLPHRAGDEYVGTGDWNALAAMANLDVLQTDPYWYPGRPWQYFVDNVDSLLSATRKNGKLAGVWVQGYGLTDGYDSISRSLQYLRDQQVPWLAVWVTDHAPNADVSAGWAAIAAVYRRP